MRIFIPVSTAIILAVLIGMLFNYRQILNRAGVEEAENYTTYSRHLVMIVNGEDTEFWQAVYESMQETAAQQDAYVELKGIGRGSSYSMTDWMDIAIASDVDGIALQNTTVRGLDGKIDEAVAAGIPVVTLMNDAPLTGRTSYIGANGYAIGQVYAARLLDLIEEGDEPVRVAVLLTDADTDRFQYQVYSQINTELVTNPKTAGRMTIEAIRLPDSGPFESEETIRDLFRADGARPDFVVCFSSLVTDAVYQAVIDFNLAGQTQIIGYYLSPTTRSALLSGNVAVTVIPDTRSMGSQSALALLEQLSEGRTNSYYNVEMQFVTGEDLAQ
ncbi:MAG: substrate-binding domain-containing protein [Lachnospiraceae bacterium]|nr:substrate-binding domain-containing protein [Lachnospiraceae bacterium]